jgi:hypothetical protein
VERHLDIDQLLTYNSDFIRYAEDIFRQQGLRANVLVMSGRFPEPAVVRRQIIEGVLAIVRMDVSGFKKGKVSVQIFDRRGGANNVQFNGVFLCSQYLLTDMADTNRIR